MKKASILKDLGVRAGELRGQCTVGIPAFMAPHISDQDPLQTLADCLKALAEKGIVERVTAVWPLPRTLHR